MFDTTNIQVNRSPFFQSIHASQFVVVVVIYITQEVPAGTCPLRHCVSFTFCRSTTFRTCCVYPFIDVSQRRFTCICRFVRFYFRQQYGQLIFGNSYCTTVFTVNDGNRFAPVSLSGEYPVTQFVVNCLFTPAFFFHNERNFRFCFCYSHAVPFFGVYNDTFTSECFFHYFGQFSIQRFDNGDNRHIEFLCKSKVTFVMSRYTHYSACTIVSQYIVSNPDRDFFAVYRVYTVGTCECTSFFFICHTVNRGFYRCFKAVFINSFFAFRFYQCRQTCVFGSQYHECTTIQCVRSCCINCDFIIRTYNFEFNFSTVGFTDPVGLHFLNFFRPIQFIQVSQQSFSIFCDFQHPLTQIFLCYCSTTTFTCTACSFFVCQYAFTAGTPVQRHFFFVSQAFFEHFRKDPLCPFIVIRICCIYFFIPVIQSRNFMQLSFYICNVCFCCNARMHVVFDRKVFCRQTKCVPTHGMQYLIALQQFITAHYVREYITSPVTYMQTRTGRIRKHIQAVKSGFYIIFFVNGIFFPFGTPFFFDFSEIVATFHTKFLLCFHG